MPVTINGNGIVSSNQFQGNVFGLGMVGDRRNLKCIVPSVAQNLTFILDDIILSDGAGNYIRSSNRTLSFTTTTSGAGGMDGGTLPATWMGIYIIYNPTSQTYSTLATNAATQLPETYSAGFMPAGYTFSALLTVVQVDANTPRNVQPFYAFDRTVSFPGTQFFNVTTQTSVLTGIGIAGYIPANARSMSGYAVANASTSAANTSWSLAGSSNGIGGQISSANNSAIQANFTNIQLPFPQQIWYTYTSSAPVSGIFFVSSYTI